MASPTTAASTALQCIPGCSSPHQQSSSAAAWGRCSSPKSPCFGTVSLPPLRPSSAEQQLEAALASSEDCSLLRRTRKAELMACALGHNPASIGCHAGLMLDLEIKEQQLASKLKHNTGKLMLEAWLDDVLTTSQHRSGTGTTPHVKGAAAAGLARQQLLAAGMNAMAVEQLYRSLYVYSVGFVDAIKELLANYEHRLELLPAIWHAFLALAEYSMKATFKSDYMALVNAAGTAVTELLCTKQVLSEVQRDNASMVKELGSLSAAEAEASAQRHSLKAEVDGLKSAYATEQTAHKRAVQQYVDALDARSAMYLQLQDAQQALAQLTAAHETLNQQHQRLQQQYDGLVGQCKVVRDVFKQVDQALDLDERLVQQLRERQYPPTALAAADSSSEQDQQQQQDAAVVAAQEAADAGYLAVDMQPLAERLKVQIEVMYATWRSAVDARDVALTERFRMADQLRAAEEVTYQAAQQQKVLQHAMDDSQQQLAASQAQSVDLTRRLTAAHESLAQHQLDLADAEGQLLHTRTKAAALDKRCGHLEETLQQMQEQATEQRAERIKLEANLTAAAQRLGMKHRLVAEMSKGCAVAMQSLWANQTARALSERLLREERAKAIHMSTSLEGKDALLRDLQLQVADQASRITKLQAEGALLESSLQDSQRQAMKLGGRLALAETKNDELTNQTQAQLEQLSDASAKINKLTTKLELAKQQLDKAHREIKELKEAAQVSERLLGESRLLSKSLLADIERLTREKQTIQDRAEATKARLEFELQQVQAQLAAEKHKLELVSADLVAERDKLTTALTLLEHKRAKKKRWKQAYTSAADEVAALHAQLLAKHKDLEALEGHLGQLHMELRMLGVATPQPRETRPWSGASGGLRMTSRPNSASPGPQSPTAAPAGGGPSLSEARKVHQSIADEVAELAEECLALDKQIQDLELEHQQLLLSLAAPDLTAEQIQGTNAAVAEKRQQLEALRQQRRQLEESRGAAADRLRKAEAALRDAHHARLQQRQQLLEQQAVEVTDLVNAAAMAQLAAAEEAEEEARKQLGQQLAAFEAAQADKAILAQRLQDMETGVDAFTSRIAGLEGDKAKLQEQLTHVKDMVAMLKGELIELTAERECAKLMAVQSEERIAALEKELEMAKQAVSAALKGLEAKHAAERNIHEQKLAAERAKTAKAVSAAEAVAINFRHRIAHFKGALDAMSKQCYWHACCSPNDRALYRDQLHAQSSSARSSMSSSDGAVPSAAAAEAPGGIEQQATFTAGERWLYLHHPGGPWATARQLLLQPEGPDGLGRFTGSGPSTPRHPVGRQVGLPPGLPGLSFPFDSLLVLIGELFLYKIDADTASEDRLLLSTAAAAAGMGSSGSQTSSRAASRPATASMAATAGSGASAAMASTGSLLNVVDDGDRQPLKGGSVAAVAAWWALRFRKDLEACVFDYFLSRCGGRLMAEAHCSALVAAIRKGTGRSKRVRIFARCLGLLEPAVPRAGVGALLHFLAHVHSTCGPLVGEANEGSSQILARTASRLASQVLQPTSVSPCAEAAGLTAAMTSAAGGSSDNSIDVDDAMELFLEAWLAQRTAEQQQQVRLVAQTDASSNGLVNQDEFVALVKQVTPAGGQHMSQEQLNYLYLAALQASGIGALAVTPAGFAATVLDAGLLGSAAHLRRHPPIAQRPPFSEYRLLQSSWQAVKPAVKEVLRSLSKAQPALAPDIATVNALVNKMDEALAACSPASEAWQLYRRIMSFYSHHGSFCDASMVSTPRTRESSLGSSLANTPRSHGLITGSSRPTSMTGGTS